MNMRGAGRESAAGYGGAAGCDVGQELSGLAGAFALFVFLRLLI